MYRQRVYGPVEDAGKDTQSDSTGKTTVFLMLKPKAIPNMDKINPERGRMSLNIDQL